MSCRSKTMEAKSIKQGIKISNLMLYLIKTRHLSKSLIKPPKICAIMFLRVITELFLLMELLELEKLILWLVTSKNQGWCFIRSINSSFKLNRLKTKFKIILIKVRVKNHSQSFRFLFWKFIMNKLEI
jgi:hypothetical protein